MRILDKILYKSKLQAGGTLAGKVIKTDKDYIENPNGTANSSRINKNDYVGINKSKITNGVYNYKGVDYLLDYIPKELNNIEYGISDKTHTKPETSVATTTNPIPITTTSTSAAVATLPIPSTNTKINGLNRGLYTAAEKADKLGITSKPMPIISSVIGGATSQQSTSNTAVQPVPAPTTTTKPEKKSGFLSRIFGKKDSKVVSNNTLSSTNTGTTTTIANNTSSSEPALPANLATKSTPTPKVPILAAPTNNPVVTEDGFSIDNNGLLLQGGKTTTLSGVEYDAARAKVEAKQRESSLQSNQNTVIQSNNTPISNKSNLPSADVIYTDEEDIKTRHSFDSKTNTITTPNGGKIVLDPNTAEQVKRITSMTNNSGSPNMEDHEKTLSRVVKEMQSKNNTDLTLSNNTSSNTANSSTITSTQQSSSVPVYAKKNQWKKDARFKRKSDRRMRNPANWFESGGYINKTSYRFI